MMLETCKTPLKMYLFGKKGFRTYLNFYFAFNIWLIIVFSFTTGLTDSQVA